MGAYNDTSAELNKRILAETLALRDSRAVVDFFLKTQQMEPKVKADHACRIILKNTPAPSQALLDLLPKRGPWLHKDLIALAENPTISHDLAEKIGFLALDDFSFHVLEPAFSSPDSEIRSRSEVSPVRWGDLLKPIMRLYFLGKLGPNSRTTTEIVRRLQETLHGAQTKQSGARIRWGRSLLLDTLLACPGLSAGFLCRLLDIVEDIASPSDLEKIILHDGANPDVWIRVANFARARSWSDLAESLAQIPDARRVPAIRSWLMQCAKSKVEILFHLCKDPVLDFSDIFRQLSERSPWTAFDLLYDAEFLASSHLALTDLQTLLASGDRDIRLAVIRRLPDLALRGMPGEDIDNERGRAKEAVEKTWRDRYLSPILPF